MYLRLNIRAVAAILCVAALCLTVAVQIHANVILISEGAELISLQALGLKTMELDYKEAKKEDEYGNYFRYRAKVKDEQGEQINRWAWDVFLVKP